MKKILMSALIVLFTGSAYSEVSIIFQSPANSVLDHNLAAIAQNQLFLVYWSSDASTSGFDNTNPTAPGGGDILLGAFNITGGAAVGGRITGATPKVFGAGTTTYSPGFCYIAVFEQTFASYSGTIANGTYYGLGPISGPLSQQNPSPTTSDNYGSLLSSGSPIRTQQQVTSVPEPSSLALVGLGIAVVALRRRFLRS